MNDLEKKVIKATCWKINSIEGKCTYCKKPAKYILTSWYGLNFTRPLCEDHKLEFILRRKEADKK